MHRKLPFLLLLLTLSGFCSLVYQVAWIRELRLLFGASTPATSVVLAVFMGGLGIGAAWFGRRAERSPNAMALYGVLELGAAVTVALSPLVLGAAKHLYIMTGGSAALGLSGATLLRIVLTILVLGVPCVLMGGNLPAAVKAIQTDRDGQRRTLGALYGFNALGAVLGASLTTFWMLEALGTRWSLYAACGLNALIAVVALMSSRSWPPVVLPAKVENELEPSSPQERLAPPNFVMGASFLCGFVFFVIELVWYRMLIPLLGGSVYAFGLILTIALLGLGIGGVFYALAGSGRTASLRAFGLVSALQACAVAMPYALGDRIAIFAYHANGLRSFELSGQIVGWTLTASIVVLLPSVIAGFQFPLLVALLGRGGREVGVQLGRAYGWNTFGAIAGALLGGFVLIPVLSAPGCWVVVSGSIAILSATALIMDQFQGKRNLLLGFAAPATCVVLALVCFTGEGPTAAWRHAPIGYGRMGQFPKTVNERRDWVREMNRRTIYDFDGRESSIALVGTSEIAFFVNGKSDGSALSDAGTQVMLGLLPALLHEAPEEACVVGLGTGCTAGWLADVPGVRRVDVIELEPGMRRIAADFAPVNRDVLGKPNVRLIDGDAREFLVTRGERYDVIASAPSNPYRAGVASLYTKEYYEAVRARLKEGGLFAQWVQCYEIDTESMRLLYATLTSVFGSVDTWATQPNDFVFVCSAERPALSMKKLQAKVATKPFEEAMRRTWHSDSLQGLLDRSVANGEFARRIAEGVTVVNTDDRNLLEFRLARSLGKWTRFNPYDVAVEAEAAGLRLPPMSEVVTMEERPKGELGMLEGLLMTDRLARAGRPEARQIVEALAGDWPVEAAVFRAHLAYHEGAHAEACRHLIDAFSRYHHDPWPHQKVMGGALKLAIALSEKWPEAAPPLFALLENPFSIHALERERLPALLALSRQLPPQHGVRAIEAWGTHSPWTKEFLAYRAECFQRAGDSRSAKAVAEVREFERVEDRPFTLVMGDEAGSEGVVPEPASQPGEFEREGWVDLSERSVGDGEISTAKRP